MKNYFYQTLLVFCSFMFFSIFAYAQTPQEVFNNVNSVSRDFSTMEFTANMKIEARGRTLNKEFYGFVDDKKERSFMEYTNTQDSGTRYLKLEDDMWIYIPDVADVLKISGHLLRDSMMGSDVSYSDMMEQGTLQDDYSAEAVSSVDLNGKSVFLLTIRAKDKNEATYVRQDLYVNKDDYSILKMVMYAAGRKEDRAIKEFILDDYKKINNLLMPMKIEVLDLRKKNSKTTITYLTIELNTLIDSKIFTRSYLES